MDVKEAEDGDTLRGGLALIAPGDTVTLMGLPLKVKGIWEAQVRKYDAAGKEEGIFPGPLDRLRLLGAAARLWTEASLAMGSCFKVAALVAVSVASRVTCLV